MEHHFETQDWVPYPVELVFAFFANPHNLPPLMPGWQKTRIERAQLVAPPPRPQPAAGRPQLKSIAAGTGSTMMISFRPFPLSPIRMPWDARIAVFQWNEAFCDEQLRGPFQLWRHCHKVKEEAYEGRMGTTVSDMVTYALPFGPLGDLVDAAAVKWQMELLFRHRQKQLRKLLPEVARQAGLEHYRG